MKPYQKKYQAEYQSLDVKPKGKWRRAIEGSNRVQARAEILVEIAEYEETAGRCSYNEFCGCAWCNPMEEDI